MHRRDFLQTSIVGLAAAGAAGHALADQRWHSALLQPELQDGVPRTQEVKLRIKPVMTNIIHSDIWEGPCRWKGIAPAEEKSRAEATFLRWPQDMQTGGLGSAGVHILEPVHVTFSEDLKLHPEDVAKIEADMPQTDAIYLAPWGAALPGCELALRFKKPILLRGLHTRNVGVTGYLRAKGCEVYPAADDRELAELASLLRARKVFRQTKILFPSDRGLPPVCAVGSVWDLEDLEKRLGVRVQQISYKELTEEMESFLADPAAAKQAEEAADELLGRAKRSFIDRKYVVRSLQFYQTIRSLMQRHACNAFTIECFEFCPSRLPQRWGITPCLLHALFQHGDFATGCEGDLSSLLSVRLLMSVSGKSCHQGNGSPTGKDRSLLSINHSAPSLKMNGFDQPDLPFQLGRFTSQGFGTKMVVDFMNNQEKTVTAARINPAANRLLVLRGQLTGASGWDRDLLGCSVEAVIRPPEGKADEYFHRRGDYGSHLQWVYGDYTRPLKILCGMLGIDVESFA